MLDEIPWFSRNSRRARYLVGVSGGADSVALLHLLVAGGFRNLVVCHLDHCLRGRASTGDARFVRRLAEKLGLECEIGRIDVAERMAASRDSMETAARNARHGFFGECAVKRRCRKVLLGHHADDQAETVLWNLLRGSHGFKGMREEQSIKTASGVKLCLLRPLLHVRHGRLVEWLVGQGHTWREDASNGEAVAVRNRLRHEVLPLLEEIGGRDSVAAFVRGAADTVEMEDFVSGELERANLLDPQGRLHLPALKKVPVFLQRAGLRRYLLEGGIRSVDRRLLDRALGMLDVEGPAVVNLPGGGRLRRSAGRIWIER